MDILGISCFYHDSAACLVRDGEIIAAVQEERFTRKKHDFNFPQGAIDWCCSKGGVGAKDLDAIVFYDKPVVKFERILETALATAPMGIRQFLQAMPLWLKEKLWIPQTIRRELGYDGKILFTEHHAAHAASAFYPSPFREAAILTMDGVGEWETASLGRGQGNALEMMSTLNFPHSLGLLYSAFTYYAGFKVNSGEYKLMGLAPYGEPKYVDLILSELMDLKRDGSFRLNMEYFDYCSGLRMVNRRFERLFGGPSRQPESEITPRTMDVAASVQKVTEEVMLRMARHAHDVTGCDKLCLAGGVALNCVGNGRILREGPFKDIWVQPASGDAGAALGAALFVWHQCLGRDRQADEKTDRQKASFLGPSYEDTYVEQVLKKEGALFKKLSYPDIPQIVSDLIIGGNVIGWFQGPLEFGPRALGGRSIIADARRAEMQSKLNLKVKFRESFRPFAPTVLREKVSEWFDLDRESPYMLLVAPVKEDKRVAARDPGASVTGFARLKEERSLIPAVTHVDYSARIQTIRREDHPLYYDTINAFYGKTGCPVIINTSFNVRGEPLVCSPEDAFKCFMRTEMDYLVMGSFLLDKKEQRPLPKEPKSETSAELD